MLEQPDRYIDPFIKAGADLISIHLEPQYDHSAALSKIRKQGLRMGL
jgi:ribulose-phosphate 3-epimerase